MTPKCDTAENDNRGTETVAATEPETESDIEARPEPETTPGREPGIEVELGPGIEPGTEHEHEPVTEPGLQPGIEPRNLPGTGPSTEVRNGNRTENELRHRAVVRSGSGHGTEPGTDANTATIGTLSPTIDSSDATDAVNFSHLNTLQAAHLLYEVLQLEDLPRFSALLTHCADQLAVINYSHGDGFTCLQYACSQRLNEFVDLLLAAGADPAAVSPASGRTALHWAAARDPGILQQVLDHAPPSAVNAQDGLRCTPLHHAIHAGSPASIRVLLRAGADVSARNDLGQPLLHALPVDVLEEHLDACVRAKRDVSDPEFGVEFDYALMWPRLPVGQTQFETAAVLHMAESVEHRQLLRHPVVRSFLDLKWWAASGLFIANLVYYSVFLVLLTVLVLLRVEKVALRDWSSFDHVVRGWYWTTVGITIPMITATAVRFSVAPVRFFFQWDSVLLKTPLMIMTAAYLLKGAQPETSEGVLDPQLSLSSMLILFAWAHSFVLLSRMPFFAIYARMYITVFIRFFWFLFWYSIIIAGFAISMYIVFSDNKDHDHHDLSTMGLTLLRTVVMILDKMDINSLPLGHCQRAANGTCPPSGGPTAAQLVFVPCLFFFTVVLTNLLNGLAISDTAALRSHAVTFSLTSRARLLAYMESILLDAPLQFLGTVVRPLADFGICSDPALIRCLAASGGMFGLRVGLARWLGLGRRLPDCRLWVFPNREREKTWPPLPEFWWMDEDVLKRARELVLRQGRGKPEVERQLSRLERQLSRQVPDMCC